MPRPPTAKFWVDQIRSAVEANERTTIAAIERKLEAVAEEAGRPINEVPSDATIKRERQKYLAMPEEVRRGYRFVFWPETFENRELPWEAAQTVGELMRTTLPQGIRVPVTYAMHFWRVSLAGPHVPFSLRRLLALNLSLTASADDSAAHAIRRNVESVVCGVAQATAPFALPLGIAHLPLLVETMAAAGVQIDPAAVAEWALANPEVPFQIVLEEAPDEPQG